MPEPAILHFQEIQHELIARASRHCGLFLICSHRGDPVCDEEDVCLDKLMDEVSSQIRGDLQGVHSQAEEHFNYVFDIIIDFFGFEQLLTMVRQNRLREHLGLSALPDLGVLLFKLIEKNLVVLPKLDLVILDGLPEAISVCVAIFKRMQMLQAIHSYLKDLACLM